MFVHNAVSADKGIPSDRDTFGELLIAYENRMKAIGYQVLGDARLAEDVMQETFLRAYANRSALHDKSNMGGYLYTIAYRVSIDFKRKAKRELIPFDDTLPIIDEDTPEQAVLRREGAERLWDAVNAVDEAYRLPLILFYQHDWPLQKIADHLSLSVPAVKSRLHRSKKALRAKLNKLAP